MINRISIDKQTHKPYSMAIGDVYEGAVSGSVYVVLDISSTNVAKLINLTSMSLLGVRVSDIGTNIFNSKYIGNVDNLTITIKGGNVD